MEDIMTISDGENSFQSIHHWGSMNTFTTTNSFHSGQIADQNESVEQVCFKIRLNETEYLPWDNPGDIAGPETEAYANRFKLTMLPFLFLIGGPGNVINMAVFCKQGLKDRVNLCLFSLSITDFVFLTSSVFLNGENILLHFSTGTIKAHSDRFMVNHNLVFFLGAGFMSSVLTAIIACERCYCVLSPLKYQNYLRTRAMAFIIVFASVTVFSLYFIVSFRYRVGCLYDPITGMLFTSLIEGEFYRRHKDLVDGLDNVVFGAALTGGVMIVVVVSTTITTAKLRQVMAWRAGTSSSSSSHSAREVALTKMLIASSVFFIVCMSSTCLLRTVCLFLPEMNAGRRLHNFYLSTLWVSEGFCYINYTFNFFIYYVMGSRYRETFWALFGRSGKGTRSQN